MTPRKFLHLLVSFIVVASFLLSGSVRANARQPDPSGNGDGNAPQNQKITLRIESQPPTGLRPPA